MRALLLLAISLPLGAQYKMDAAGDPAPNPMFQSPGVKVLGSSNAVFCEVWLAKVAPQGGTSTEAAVTLPTFPVGSLIGAIRFPAKGADRRGQTIPAGTYLLRYVQMPVDGSHLGAAPQRDFLALVATTDTGAKMSLEEIIAASTRISGTKHPAVLSVSPGSGKTAFTQEGKQDWVLNTKVGDLPIAITLLGKAES